MAHKEQNRNKANSREPLSRYELRTPSPNSAPIWLMGLGALLFIFSTMSITINFPLELSPELKPDDPLKFAKQIQAILLSFGTSLYFILFTDRIAKYLSERKLTVPLESLNENLNAGVD